MLDIAVPQFLFSVIYKQLRAKKSQFGLKYDCKLRDSVKDIVFEIKNNSITIPGNVFADQIEEDCFLRLKPSANNDFVLGLQFYYAYATCFDGEKKVVHFNKSYHKELE